MKDAIEAARIELAMAESVAGCIKGLRQAEADELRSAAFKIIDRDMKAKYGEQEDAALKEKAEAALALNALLIEYGKAKLAAVKDPAMVEWRYKRVSSFQTRYVMTGRRGVLDVWHPGAMTPSGMTGWNFPQVGDIYIRVTKKDGSPSAYLEKLPNENWKPVSWSPPNQEKKQ